MTVEEFYNKIKGIDFEDEWDLLGFHYNGHYTGHANEIKVVGNKIILSGEFKPNLHTVHFNDLKEKCKELAESPDTYDYQVYYGVPSQGVFEVLDAKKIHYDYSADGDDIYDCVEVKCADESICAFADLEKTVNPDDYEDFFEDLLNLENKPMNETIDGKYAAACYRAERVLASFYKDFGKEMTRMAFEHELDDIDF